MEAIMTTQELDKATMGKAFKMLRAMRELPQQQVSSAMGLSQSTYSPLEKGVGTDANFLAACQYFGYTPEDLILWFEKTVAAAAEAAGGSQ